MDKKTLLELKALHDSQKQTKPKDFQGKFARIPEAQAKKIVKQMSKKK